jgi:tetratricopeptide (TPR) repeat protein
MKKLIILIITLLIYSLGYGQTTAKDYLVRGRSKSNLQDYRGAIADYNKVIELNPKVAVAYYNRGLEKSKVGEKDSACLDLSKAGELSYDSYEAISELCK